MRDLSASEWAQVDPKRFFFFGTLFTITVDALIYPLQLVTTRVQVEARSRATVWEASLRVARDVFRRDGGAGLYRGFVLFTAGGLPSQGAYFYGYNWARARLGEVAASQPPETRPPQFLVDAAAGMFADVVAAPLWTPVEVVTTRLQIQGPGAVAYAGARDAAARILRAEGVSGLFRGLSATVFAFGPASALWWSTYEATKRRLGALAGARGDDSVVVDAAAGLLAGCVSSAVTNPLDIAKTRLQAQHGLLRELALDGGEAEAWGGTAAAPRCATSAATAAASPSAEFLYGHLAQQQHYASHATAAMTSQRRRRALGGSSSGGGAAAAAAAAAAPPPPAQLGPPLPAEPPRRAGAGAPAHMSDLQRSGALDRFARVDARLALEKRRFSVLGGVRTPVVRVHAAAAVVAAGGRAPPPPPPLSTPAPAPAPPAAAPTYPLPSATARWRLQLLPNFLYVSFSLGPPFRTTGPGSAAVAEATAQTLADIEAGARRLQAREAAAARSGGGGRAPQTHKGMLAMLSHIIRTDGPGALIRGLLPRLLLQGPASAATLVCYEQVLHLSRARPSALVE
jgi:solute carrier family 25 iron transporter 28/37